MPAVTRKGDSCSGHDACPPRPSIEGEETVTVCGKPLMRVGHHYGPHGCKDHPPHDAVLAGGAANATLGGQPIGRVGDPVSCGGTVAEGCASVTIGNNGGLEWQRAFWRENITDPSVCLVPCLPEMAASQAENENKTNKKGWLYLHDFAEKWLSKKAYIMQGSYDNGGQDPYWIDWAWLVEYRRFSEAIDELKEQKYLFTPAAKSKLADILTNDGAFNGNGTAFDHITQTAHYTWKDWRKHAFQGKPIGGWWKGMFPQILVPDGLLAAMGDITIFALAQGETKVANGKKTIIVRQIGMFIHDGFDFSGDQFLGLWECSKEHKGFDSFGKELNNKLFRDFRTRTGYGCDFRVMSGPHLVYIKEFSYDLP